MLNGLFVFTGGTALFIFALGLMENALKNLAGRSFKKFLQKQTESKIRAIFGGTVVTALLQSSSVVLLMTLSFVGAGFIGMRNALAVTFGSNLGTTLSNWVVATLGFKTDFTTIAYILLSITILGFFFSKNNTIKQIVFFITGFSLIFISLDLMKNSGSELLKSYDPSKLSDLSVYIFIPIGFLVTFLIQSSSATVAITLTALYNKAIPFESALAVVIGSELGTTMKLLIGSINGIPDKKRVAIGNFLFNMIITIVAIVLLNVLASFIKNYLHIEDNLIALVFFQTIINVIGIALFYPFMNPFSAFLEKLFITEKKETQFIKKSPQPFAEDDLILAEKEVLRLVNRVIHYNRQMLGIEKKHESVGLFNYIRYATSNNNMPEENYQNLKILQGEILDYLSYLPKQEMNKEELNLSANLITACRNSVHSAKNIKDIAHNLRELESSANDELHSVYKSLLNEESVFYDNFEKLIQTGRTDDITIRLESIAEANKKKHEEKIAEILHLLNTRKISKIDASSLMNVFREIYSSHKALKEVLEDMWMTNLKLV